ncbi:MAG: Rrf2 family transcriptional regulator [Nitrospirae bacterium]|nr:Rrf2 family transcriptional regulator [Nitrospirota bacterium]
MNDLTIKLIKYTKGILQSQKGKGGGYLLGRSSREIIMGQIVRIIDGPLAPLPCVSQTAYRKCAECHDELTCGIRMVMKEVRDSTAKILDRISMSEVLRNVKTLERLTHFKTV